MSSYSICSFILIAWRLASGLIYCTLLRLDSKDRIIHFLLDCSAVLTLSEHITNFNESLQYPRKSKVHWPPFIGRALQHFHLALVSTFIWIAFSLPFQEKPSFAGFFPHLIYWMLLLKILKSSAVWGRNTTWKILMLLTEQCLYRATALSLDGKSATSVTEAATFKKGSNLPWAAVPRASPQLCPASPAGELVSVFMASSLFI